MTIISKHQNMTSMRYHDVNESKADYKDKPMRTPCQIVAEQLAHSSAVFVPSTQIEARKDTKDQHETMNCSGSSQ